MIIEFPANNGVGGVVIAGAVIAGVGMVASVVNAVLPMLVRTAITIFVIFVSPPGGVVL